MTLLVVLMWGAGAILIVSAIETDPSTGQSVSVLQTVSDIWNDKVDFHQPASTSGGPNLPGGNGGVQLPGWPPTNPFPQASASVVTGGAAGRSGLASYDAYRNAEVRAWLQSQR